MNSLTQLPVSYSADLWTDGSSQIERILANCSPDSVKKVVRSKLIEQETIAGTPLNPELVEQCGFKPRRNDDYVPVVDLLHITEIARQERIADAHWVGGKVLLTTVTRDGVTQRVVHHYWEIRSARRLRLSRLPTGRRGAARGRQPDCRG